MKAWVAIAGIVMSMLPFHALAIEERQVILGDLHATLTLPEGTRPVSGVLIIAGSGPVDRDGNLPGAENNSLKLLAHGLAAQGVASLRTDKRGVAQSASAAIREEDLRFETYVNDAAGWLQVLAGQARVKSLFIAGHSEGALVATMVAGRHKVDGLILLAGAGNPAAHNIEKQLEAAGLPADLRDAARRISNDLLAGRTSDDVPAPLFPLYRTSVQPYLMSWFSLDPAAELKAIAAPVLIVQGGADLQISADDFSRLREASPHARSLTITGMNHVLKVVDEGRAANLAAYNDPSRPLAEPLLPGIVDFIATAQ